MSRVTLRLTFDCNNACVFCAQRGLSAVSADATRDQLLDLRERSDEITFTGGEPTLAPALIESIVEARRLGFRSVGLQTNGRRLADESFTARLVDAGLTDVHLSIHGAEAAVHDHHAGVPGALTEVVAGLRQARGHHLVVAVTTVLTRSNYRVLWSIPPMLRAHGVAAWLITLPRITGALVPGREHVSPRLGIAMPFVLAAIDEAGKLGLEAHIQGAPACTLGPFSTRILHDEPRAYAPVCGTCPSRSFCPGVDPAYLRQFRGDELASKELHPPAALTPVSSLFVGVGEVAPPRDEPSQRANVVALGVPVSDASSLGRR